MIKTLKVAALITAAVAAVLEILAFLSALGVVDIFPSPADTILSMVMWPVLLGATCTYFSARHLDY